MLSKGSDGRGSLPDLSRLRTNVVKTIEEDEVIGELSILKEMAERQYRSNMAIEVEKRYHNANIWPVILDTENKTVIRELQSKATSLWALLSHLCQTNDKTPNDKNHAKIISIVSNICFAKHPRLCNLWCQETHLKILLPEATAEAAEGPCIPIIHGKKFAAHRYGWVRPQ